MSKQIYITWIDFQRRAESMNQYVDFDLYYLPPPVSRKWLKPFGYLLQAWRTIRIVLAEKPDVVWVQSPPSLVPHILLGLRAFTRRYGLIVDCHNASMLPPWVHFPAATWVLNHSDRVLVHNEEMRGVVEAHGVRPELVRVLEDPPAMLDLPPAAPRAPDARPYVLVPCSFNPDEHLPLPAVMGAARLLPEVDFKITGRKWKAEAQGLTKDAPPNVHFTDYLTIGQFEALLAGANVVLGVTSRTNCQLSVANEALGAHSPLVLSDTGILRKMFGDAALFGENTPEALAAALGEALAHQPEMRAKSEALKLRRQESWLAEARRASQIGNGPASGGTPGAGTLVKPPAGR
ncbi:glycosyltransferase [Amaricoccus solimangrovi]|uniref:Glycosyltransferase family 4 protein n=1 Tax=Amaricoccus solimangrovi TaxID=2589815 RepID=A0A501WEZ7_9RHOB|nr:glycosyltransferase [Amaricoccus solimangrovi]TPE48423.1 glycosyltransferase family 4 protein [Amaricoccus solimangrovi]